MLYGPDGKCLWIPVPQKDDNCEALTHLVVLYMAFGITTVIVGVTFLCLMGLTLPTH